jgi:ankyrin repeat protein
VKYFLSSGCDDTIKNANGWLPIHLAALTGKQGDEIVRLLLEHNKDNATVTEFSSKILIQQAKNDQNGWTAFHIAISKNSFKQIPHFLHTNLNATSKMYSHFFLNFSSLIGTFPPHYRIMRRPHPVGN